MKSEEFAPVTKALGIGHRVWGMGIESSIAGLKSRLRIYSTMYYVLRAQISLFLVELSKKPGIYASVILNLIQDPQRHTISGSWIPGQARNDGCFSEPSVNSCSLLISRKNLPSALYRSAP